MGRVSSLTGAGLGPREVLPATSQASSRRWPISITPAPRDGVDIVVRRKGRGMPWHANMHRGHVQASSQLAVDVSAALSCFQQPCSAMGAVPVLRERRFVRSWSHLYAPSRCARTQGLGR